MENSNLSMINGVVMGSDLMPLGAESVSPVSINSDWSRVARLLLLLSLSVIGSVGNVFMISAVMIEDHLKKRGNAFIVNVALADLLVTGLVMPASAVVILADADGSLAVCQFQWFLSVLSFLVTIVTLICTAADNYRRLCSGFVPAPVHAPPAHIQVERPPPQASTGPGRRTVTTVILVSWAACGAASGLQFAHRLGLDYCSRDRTSPHPTHAAGAALLATPPLALTSWWYARTLWRVRAARRRPSFKPALAFEWDYSLMKTNLYSFLTFIVFWLPLGAAIATATVRTVSDRVFYNLAWFAISKSCVNSLLYCATNRHFRHAYVNLFHYCCCKTTVSFSRRQRAAGANVAVACGGGGSGGDASRPSGDVRVHIIPGYNMYTSPQRARDCPGKRTASCRLGAAGSRDVYEL